jgi:hypothetical protein
MNRGPIIISDIVNSNDSIYNKISVNDIYKSGYNLGDLLNMSYLGGRENKQNCPHAWKEMLDRMIVCGEFYKDTVLHFYCKKRKSYLETVPNIPLIVESVKIFAEQNIENFDMILPIVKDPETLVVHVRSGDYDTESKFIDLIIKLSDKYKQIVILAGIHADIKCRDMDSKYRNFLSTINSLLSSKNNIYIYLESPDIHLSIMSYSANLLLHKGGFTCLGAIVATGNLYLTKYLGHETHENWKKNITKKYTILDV